jgi:peptidylprolyl isomerase
MSPGEKKTIEIPARLAFGGRQRTLLRVLKRELFAPDQKIRVGQRLRVDQGDGTSAVVEVTRVSGGEVMVDMNHPLAGRDLVFAVEMVEIL